MVKISLVVFLMFSLSLPVVLGITSDTSIIFRYPTIISGGNTLICINGTAGNNISCVGPTGPTGPAGNGTMSITSINQTQMSNISGVLNILESWLTTFVNGVDMFYQGTVGNTKGAIINRIDNHTQNSNNIIFAVMGNGTSNVMMPHFWIQNGASSQASGVSRSFMIVNENPTQQNTSNITSCQSFASYANKTLLIDCNTTTTGADLLVGDDIQAFGDAYFNNVNITGTTATVNIDVSGNVSIKRPYGSWSSTQTQVMTNSNQAYPITFNWTDAAYQITKTNNVNFSVKQTGNYLVGISAIMDVDSPNVHNDLWIQYWNGTGFQNVPRSNTKVQIPNSSTEAVVAVTFIMPANTTDVFRIMMATDNGGASLLYTAGDGVRPESPSIIMTATKVSELTP